MDLNIAEIFYETGDVRFRYARYLSPDGARWIRHGLFTEFHRNGQLASQGMYADGVEEGSWQDFYESGQIAAEGMYYRGAEVGIWRYWNYDGIEELPENRGDGSLVE
ncbi:toxin-antitoxin system YwqK family antitoxin [Janthinobacterium sp. NFX145]|uniref:toxin-antitoxin system YwqK family antitoxin n=1 Tax=Janthinobacterium sp. NFX145 TaxID=3415602 RepID=UPI003CC61921